MIFVNHQQPLHPFASFRPEGEIFGGNYSFQDAVLKKIVSRTHVILIRSRANKANIIRKVEMVYLLDEECYEVVSKQSFGDNVPNGDVGYEVDGAV